jgi:hypothetical protein
MKKNAKLIEKKANLKLRLPIQTKNPVLLIKSACPNPG